MESLLGLASTHSSCPSPHSPGPILSGLSLPVWEGLLCSSTPLGIPTVLVAEVWGGQQGEGEK